MSPPKTPCWLSELSVKSKVLAKQGSRCQHKRQGHLWTEPCSYWAGAAATHFSSRRQRGAARNSPHGPEPALHPRGHRTEPCPSADLHAGVVCALPCELQWRLLGLLAAALQTQPKFPQAPGPSMSQAGTGPKGLHSKPEPVFQVGTAPLVFQCQVQSFCSFLQPCFTTDYLVTQKSLSLSPSARTRVPCPLLTSLREAGSRRQAFSPELFCQPGAGCKQGDGLWLTYPGKEFAGQQAGLPKVNRKPGESPSEQSTAVENTARWPREVCLGQAPALALGGSPHHLRSIGRLCLSAQPLQNSRQILGTAREEWGPQGSRALQLPELPTAREPAQATTHPSPSFSPGPHFVQ